jgi:hypothetical protein
VVVRYMVLYAWVFAAQEPFSVRKLVIIHDLALPCIIKRL